MNFVVYLSIVCSFVWSMFEYEFVEGQGKYIHVTVLLFVFFCRWEYLQTSHRHGARSRRGLKTIVLILQKI